MGEYVIEELKAEADLIDRLVVTVKLAGGFSGETAVVLGFQGDLVFDVTPMPEGQTGPKIGKHKLPLRWMCSERSVTVKPSQSKKFEFTAPLSRDALGRLEAFRDGGKLFARVHGEFRVAYAMRANAGVPDAWLDNLKAVIHESGGPAVEGMLTKCSQYNSESWNDNVVSVLKPPGNFVVEFTVLQVDDSGEAADVVASLEKAKKALNGSKHPDFVKELLRTLKLLEAELHRVEERHGEWARSQVEARLTALATLCSSLTEKTALNEPKMKNWDRNLSRHVFADTASLVGFLFNVT